MTKIITIDVRMIKHSGIGTYIQNVVPEVMSRYNQKYVLIGNKEVLANYDWTRKKNVEILDCDSPIYSIKEQIDLKKIIPKNTDLYWAPHYNIPLFYKGKLMVTVHDVFHLAFPEYVKGMHKKLYVNYLFSSIKRRANKIITVSDFSKLEIISRARINGSKIVVIHNGVSKKLYNENKVQSPYDKSYILYVGNVKPHKNLISLIEALNKIKNNIPYDLLIVGKKEGFITSDNHIIKKAESLGSRVQFTGYIDDLLLTSYYKNASMLVFPSLYEGFGLPPLEAMANNCPVIVSNVASLPEICGDAAIYINPKDIKGISDAIVKLDSEDGLRETMIKKGNERVKNFNWRIAGDKTIKVIEEIMNS